MIDAIHSASYIIYLYLDKMSNVLGRFPNNFLRFGRGLTLAKILTVL